MSSAMQSSMMRVFPSGQWCGLDSNEARPMVRHPEHSRSLGGAKSLP